MLMERAKEYRTLRAPSGDGETLVEPSFASLPDVVARNRAQRFKLECDMQGRTLSELGASARRGLFEAALRYTQQYRGVPQRWQNNTSISEDAFLLSGHQPELFHPGVWYKNFVLGSLARQLNGVGIHLLIDSDTCRGASIRVPAGSGDEPRLEAVPYDKPAPEVPHEERTVLDQATFSTFAERSASYIRTLVPDPLVAELWPLVMERNPGEKNLGLRLAQGRHALEETWHNETLELPQSVVCQLPEFAWFVAHLLANLPRFWAAYNDALAYYRRAHRMRGHAQPVPDLDAADGWLEAPFWIWSGEDPQRRPLFARQAGDELVITDRKNHTIALSLTADGEAASAAGQLLDLSSHGIKLRTRALTTTLFARLVLSDLFLHGIGGAKYDQVTDQIVRLFFDFEPPEFATVSATLRLPIANEAYDSAQIGQTDQLLRALRYHPEQFVKLNGDTPDGQTEAAAQLIAAKRRWVSAPKTRENARERHMAIEAANEGLQQFVASLREDFERERNELQLRRRRETILRSRDYAFCLYPRRHFETLLRGADF
jgi:hypothetical protein